MNNSFVTDIILRKYTGIDIDVYIPDSITKIGEYAFNNKEIKSVLIPGSVKIIDNYAFKNCSKLENVLLSYGIEKLGKGVFYNCNSLTSIVLPSTLESISSDAFYGCTSLISIVFNSDNFSIVNKSNKFDFNNCLKIFITKDAYENNKLFLPSNVEYSFIK